METAKNLNEVLLMFQGQVGKLNKDRVNPHFKSRYATLSSVWDTVRKPLTDCGLTVKSRIENGEVITELVHAASGESISSRMAIPGGNVQQIGSGITYLRRYSLVTMLNLTTEEDDDGNAAATAQQPQPQQKQPAQPAAPAPQQPQASGKPPFEASMCDTRLLGLMAQAAKEASERGQKFNPSDYLTYWFEINPQQIDWVVSEYNKYTQKH